MAQLNEVMGHLTGYNVFVASPTQPKAAPKAVIDNYQQATIQGVTNLVIALREKISSKDELLVYTMGNGTLQDKQPQLCLEDGCNNYQLTRLVENIPYSQRTIVMMQPYGLQWAEKFFGDDATLFIAADRNGETNTLKADEGFDDFFWKAHDLSNDGTIDWWERFSYAFVSTPLALGCYLPSNDYIPYGFPPFEYEDTGNPFEFISNKTELDNALTKVLPGQYAFLLLVPPGVKNSEAIQRNFISLATKRMGHELFMITENADLAFEYGVVSKPAILIATGQKGVGQYVTDNIENPFKELYPLCLQTEKSPKPVSDILADILIIGDASTKARFLVSLFKSRFAESVKLLDQFISIAVGIHNPSERARALTDLALVLSNHNGEASNISRCFNEATSQIVFIDNFSEFKETSYYLVETILNTGLSESEKKELVLKILKLANQKIANKKDRSEFLIGLATTLAKQNNLNFALEVLDLAIKTCKKIQDPRELSVSGLRIIIFIIENRLEDQKALAILKKISPMGKKISEPSSQASFYAALAMGAARFGLVDFSEEDFQKAKEIIAKKVTSAQEQAKVWRDIIKLGVVVEGSPFKITKEAFELFLVALVQLQDTMGVITPLFEMIASSNLNEVEKTEFINRLANVAVKLGETRTMLSVAAALFEGGWKNEAILIVDKELERVLESKEDEGRKIGWYLAIAEVADEQGLSFQVNAAFERAINCFTSIEGFIPFGIEYNGWDQNADQYKLVREKYADIIKVIQSSSTLSSQEKSVLLKKLDSIYFERSVQYVEAKEGAGISVVLIELLGNKILDSEEKKKYLQRVLPLYEAIMAKRNWRQSSSFDYLNSSAFAQWTDSIIKIATGYALIGQKENALRILNETIKSIQAQEDRLYGKYDQYYSPLINKLEAAKKELETTPP